MLNKKIIPAAVVAGIASMSLAGTASASVNINPDGTGFVGKGDVQTAFNWKNELLQSYAKGVKFTSSQSATQALSQDVTQRGTQGGKQIGTQSGTQTATQSATQSVLETLSCMKTNGNVDSRFRYGTRDAERVGSRSATRSMSRDGSREGSRDGSRVGSRAGVINGTIASALDGDPRQTKGQNQFTGFILKGKVESPFVSTGQPAWDAPTYGDYTFGAYKFGDWSHGDWSADGEYNFADYTFGDAGSWGEWEAAPNEDPEGVCKEGSSNVVPGSIVDTVTYGEITNGPVKDGAITADDVKAGDITDGGITDGSVEYGTETAGAITKSGSLKVFASYDGSAGGVVVTAKPLN